MSIRVTSCEKRPVTKFDISYIAQWVGQPTADLLNESSSAGRNK